MEVISCRDGAAPSISFGFELHSLPVATPKFNVAEEHTYDGMGHCDYEDYGGNTPSGRSGTSTPYSMYSMYSAVPMSTADVVLAFLREAKAEELCLGPPAALACRSRANSMTSLCSEQQPEACEAHLEAAPASCTVARSAGRRAAPGELQHPDPLPPWHPTRNPYWQTSKASRKLQHSHSFISISTDCTSMGFSPAMTAAAAAAAGALEADDTEEPTERSGGLLGLGLGLGRLIKTLLAPGSAGQQRLLAAPGTRAAFKADRHCRPRQHGCDDRQQLVRRVSELSKERSGLAERVAALGAAVAEEQAAAGQLRQRLQQVEAERDEVVRVNAALQHKLTALENSHAALGAPQQEAQPDRDQQSLELERLLESVWQH